MWTNTVWKEHAVRRSSVPPVNKWYFSLIAGSFRFWAAEETALIMCRPFNCLLRTSVSFFFSPKAVSILAKLIKQMSNFSRLPLHVCSSVYFDKSPQKAEYLSWSWSALRANLCQRADLLPRSVCLHLLLKMTCIWQRHSHLLKYCLRLKQRVCVDRPGKRT